FSFIYFARSHRITAQHGHVALVDVATGRLIPPLQRISGNAPDRPLPDWNIALQHAKIAHQACSNFAFIGWDIALTDHGPVLLEGNANWNADEYQSMTGKPLGHTKFAKILAARLKEISPKS